MSEPGTPAKRPGAPRARPNLELLRRRIELGLSRGDIADLAGITPKQVGLIERGIARRPREATMRAIAKAVEADTLDIFDVSSRVRRAGRAAK